PGLLPPFSPSLDSLATVPTAAMCACTMRPSGSVTGADSPTWASCCWLAFTCSGTSCPPEVVPRTAFGAAAPEPPPFSEDGVLPAPSPEAGALEPDSLGVDSLEAGFRAPGFLGAVFLGDGFLEGRVL